MSAQNPPWPALDELHAVRRVSGRSLGAASGASVECSLPTAHGEFRLIASESGPAGATRLTLVHGDPGPGHGAPLHRHVHCLLGDTFGGALCDCREHLQQALAEILAAGAGTLVYIKPARENPFSCPRSFAAYRETVSSGPGTRAPAGVSLADLGRVA